MKQKILALLCGAVMAFGMAAGMAAGVGAESTDYSSYSFDELMAIKEDVENELLTRPEYEGLTLGTGTYIVGKDIPAGKYEIMLSQTGDNHESCQCCVYDSLASMQRDMDAGVLLMPILDEYIEEDYTSTITLYEGNCLYLSYNGLSMKLVGLIEDNPNDSYEIPERTEVPIGKYAIGTDIPEGTFSVYYNGKGAGRCGVYDTEEDANDSWSKGVTSVMVTIDTPSTSINLKEGQYLRVDGNPVIMKKGAGLVFD